MKCGQILQIRTYLSTNGAIQVGCCGFDMINSLENKENSTTRWYNQRICGVGCNILFDNHTTQRSSYSSASTSSASDRNSDSRNENAHTAHVAMKVPVSPYVSPILPRTGVKMPPTLTISPSVMPDAKPTWFGRYL